MSESRITGTKSRKFSHEILRVTKGISYDTFSVCIIIGFIYVHALYYYEELRMKVHTLIYEIDGQQYVKIWSSKKKADVFINAFIDKEIPYEYFHLEVE